MRELHQLKIPVLPGSLGKQEGWLIARSVGERETVVGLGPAAAEPRAAAPSVTGLGRWGL